MSSAGTIFDMIARYNGNRALLRGRNEISRVKKLYAGYATERGVLTVTELPPEQLEAIRSEIRLKLRRRRRKELVRSIIFSILLLAAIAAIIWLCVSLHRNHMNI